MKGWTDIRRRQQAERIRDWQPWKHSTGPQTAEGKAKASRNAYKGSTRRHLREIAGLLAMLENQENGSDIDRQV